jgi:hypothetical protein
MVAWHVNEGLAVLNKQMDSLFPGMTIYTIGDAAHQHEVSDHNPNSAGRVNASDFMIRGLFYPLDAFVLSRVLTLDVRTKYAIYNRQIWEAGKWTTYTGSNPHTDHVHLSVFDSAHTDLRPWKVRDRTVTLQPISGFMPVLKEGDHDPIVLPDGSRWWYVSRAQKSLGVTDDGIYGADTRHAVQDLMDDKDINGSTIDVTVWTKLTGLRPRIVGG